jgi:hypothetical protein
VSTVAWRSSGAAASRPPSRQDTPSTWRHGRRAEEHDQRAPHRPTRNARRSVIMTALFISAVIVTVMVTAPRPSVQPAEPWPVQRLNTMLSDGRCWNDLGQHPLPRHAFFSTPASELHYGPSAPALRIVFGPDGEMNSGDEAPGVVYAFCR